MSWTHDNIRETFLNYFIKKHQHEHVEGTGVVPYNDPSLLFINSGMAQFKEVFLGTIDPLSKFGKLRRVVNSQKCIRAGGKHNDLDDVGRDVYHHTFFEMLGTWSFGDYFKREAIEMALDLLTNVYGIDKNRLYFTYFGGNSECGIEMDSETYDVFRSLGISEDRILSFGMKENFWEMGETGPCGPCAEIHYDRIGGTAGERSRIVNMDDPDMIEIWNLVFMQYSRVEGGALKALPNKHVDTGMGFERLVSVLQNKRSSYDTSVFSSILSELQQKASVGPYLGLVGVEDSCGINTAYRVVADHIRTIAIAIGDGCVPSNTGRGYVLRRILRRALRFAVEKLGLKKGTLSALSARVFDELGPVFPNLLKDPGKIVDIIDKEESLFSSTLEKGLQHLNRYLSEISLDSGGTGILCGDKAWILYDTFGFPLDLTEIIARERGCEIDHRSYYEHQERARETSKTQKVSDGSIGQRLERFKLRPHLISELISRDIPKTNDSLKYEQNQSSLRILSILDVDSECFIESAIDGLIGLIFDDTVFYCESGGQQSDVGVVENGSGGVFSIEKVMGFGGYVIHFGTMKSGGMCVGDVVVGSYDIGRRHKLAINHTATHVLNFSLRKHLGNGVDQRGSLVMPNKIRFDLSYHTKLGAGDIESIERIGNELIRRDESVYTEELPLADAKRIPGIRVISGEQYPSMVRVVSVGASPRNMLEDVQQKDVIDHSIELCGGTHVASTGQIERLVVLSECGISQNTRRIVCVTGRDAERSHEIDEELRLELEGLEAPGDLKLFEDKLGRSETTMLGRMRIMKRFEEIRKRIDGEEKQKKVHILNQIQREIECFKKEGEVFVFGFDMSDNPKTLLSGIEALRKHNIPGCLFSMQTCGDVSRVQFFMTAPGQSEDAISTWIDSMKGDFLELKCGGNRNLTRGTAHIKAEVCMGDLVRKMRERFVVTV